MAVTKYNEYKNKPTLKKGEKAVYELQGIGKDPLDPKGGMVIPAVFGIPATDRIYDSDKDDYIDIAYVTGQGQGGEPIVGELQFTGNMMGLMQLQGGKASDQAKYEYMEKCNFNGSNPDRDTSKPVYFTRKDYKAEAKAKREKRDEMIEAVNQARKLDVAHLRQVALGIGFTGITDDNDQLREKVEDYAEANPKKFLAVIENKDLSIMEVASEAQKKGNIVIDNQSRRITTSTGEVLVTWGPEPNVNPLDKFVEYVKSDNGSQFYAELKENLKSKKK